MAAMGHDGRSLSFNFKFPFQNKSVLIKSNLINEMTTIRTTYEKQNVSKSINHFGFGYQFDM